MYHLVKAIRRQGYPKPGCWVVQRILVNSRTSGHRTQGVQLHSHSMKTETLGVCDSWNVLLCVMLQEGSSTACCSDALLSIKSLGVLSTPYSRKYAKKGQIYWLFIGFLKAFLITAWSPSWEAFMYCSDLFCQLKEHRSSGSPLTFQCTLSWEGRNKKRIPKEPQRKKHFSLTFIFIRAKERGFVGFLLPLSWVWIKQGIYFFCHLSSGW